MPFDCYMVEISADACRDDLCLKDLYLAIVENHYWIEYKDLSDKVFLYKKTSPTGGEDPLAQGEAVVNRMVQRFTSDPTVTIEPLSKLVSPSVLQPATLEEIRYQSACPKIKKAMASFLD